MDAADWTNLSDEELLERKISQLHLSLDGTGLEQVTTGPHHDVGPAYLPDGRIVFSSTRSGIRDEYHGYPCTILCIMDADGRNIHSISSNIGRDNEPSILADAVFDVVTMSFGPSMKVAIVFATTSTPGVRLVGEKGVG